MMPHPNQRLQNQFGDAPTAVADGVQSLCSNHGNMYLPLWCERCKKFVEARRDNDLQTALKVDQTD